MKDPETIRNHGSAPHTNS